MQPLQVKKDTDFLPELSSRLESDGAFSSWNLFSMAYEAEQMSSIPSFNGLRSLDLLSHVHFYDHQTSCAEQVIQEMNGRAILADEVGLGKTIEAGLILKEYMIRGLVKNALILVPASLVSQWVKELNEKFYIPAVAHRKNYPWDGQRIIVSSIDTAKKSPHKEQIQEITYDFMLIDEAHKLKNHKTKNYQFIRSLKKKYCLLLTATPVQNRLIEIFNLVSILKPGHLGNYDAFQKKHGSNRRNIQEDYYLKQLIQQVMVRNTRKQANFNDVKRKIETKWVEFSDEEWNVYQDLENTALYLKAFSKTTLLREICSSREACFLSLQKLAKNHPSEIEPIIRKIENLPNHAKANKAVQLIQEIGDEKVIIFTEYRGTQLYLQWYLKQFGITSVPFRGGFKHGKKDWMKQLFRDKAQVLIATEAGGEGINLQFCHHLINYDLPWNPMRLEQRIGRIHRYGQTSDVKVYNFAIKNTIEEHIMTLLYDKIHLFEQVIGHLDDILADLQLSNIESEIEEIYNESTSQGEVKIKLNNIASVINAEASDRQEKEANDGYN